MTFKRAVPFFLIAGSVLALCACASLERGPVGNLAVPEPARPVDLTRYAGRWYEIGRYENGFERGCEAVTADYAVRDDGLIGILNTCREGGVSGPIKSSTGKAKVVAASQGTRLKVSFFGPFYVGDYWVLDHADDYSWSIVGEPSGRYLWQLSRVAEPSAAVRSLIADRTRALGYDLAMVRATQH